MAMGLQPKSRNVNCVSERTRTEKEAIQITMSRIRKHHGIAKEKKLNES